jgi:hypothetical protein
MNSRLISKFGLLNVLVAFITVIGPDSAAWTQTKTPSAPKFEEIEKAVWEYFQAQSNFQSASIITKEQVQPLLPKLEQMGFTLNDPKSILDKLPVKGEFLVKELTTPAGRKFCKQIAKYPEAYDRLDRLSRLPHGKQTVHDLIYGAGGYKMIQYMTTAQGGIEMGKMLSQAPGGADFNKPTGRIYTVPMLLRQFQDQYRAVEKTSANQTQQMP